MSTSTPESPEQTAARLAAEIGQLKRTGERDAAETLVEIGLRLLVAKQGLFPTTGFEGWVDAACPFGISAAKNYLGLAAWAQDYPGHFQRLKSLGPAKLYALRRFSGEQVAELGLTTDYTVGDRTRRLGDMSSREFQQFVVAILGLPAKQTARQFWSRFGRRMGHLVADTERLMTHRGALPEDKRRSFVASLRALADELEVPPDGDDP